ncbi:metalloregulator ArsR/SmtB family transcription factor [Maricaulis sp.]|uniref:ArsR/SmtB family transcription factor n=1 Tax=Maricaulis sp. TaxID=1486257 RepID=UPI001B1355B6|nr:metalloregulator ArsR/SmtB family transcription factor [Maricaulis sp.]MBO6798219.1 helix-turn-helix transcriptional regulator [Maricaulis sp.]
MKKNDAISALGALAHDSRLDIFRLLVSWEAEDPAEAGLAAGAIAEKLSLPSPTASFHLKELSRAGLVEGTRRGRSIIYRAQLDTLRSVADFLLHDCCSASSPRIRSITP